MENQPIQASSTIAAEAIMAAEQGRMTTSTSNNNFSRNTERRKKKSPPEANRNVTQGNATPRSLPPSHNHWQGQHLYHSYHSMPMMTGQPPPPQYASHMYQTLDNHQYYEYATGFATAPVPAPTVDMLYYSDSQYQYNQGMHNPRTLNHQQPMMHQSPMMRQSPVMQQRPMMPQTAMQYHAWPHPQGSYGPNAVMAQQQQQSKRQRVHHHQLKPRRQQPETHAQQQTAPAIPSVTPGTSSPATSSVPSTKSDSSTNAHQLDLLVPKQSTSPLNTQKMKESNISANTAQEVVQDSKDTNETSHELMKEPTNKLEIDTNSTKEAHGSKHDTSEHLKSSVPKQTASSLDPQKMKAPTHKPPMDTNNVEEMAHDAKKVHETSQYLSSLEVHDAKDHASQHLELLVPKPSTSPLDPQKMKEPTTDAHDAHDAQDVHQSAEASARRSGRERSSTVLYVDGHCIKKENNYVMKGMSYEYGVAQGSEEQPAKKQKTATVPATTKAAAPPQPRPPTLAELQRQRMKQAIAHRVESKQGLRDHFLKANLRHLKPFVDEKVWNRIQALPAPSAGFNTGYDSVLQPDAIQADMRDYQLQGLQWMASMYSKNIGFILGDEMGLGKTLQTIALVVHLKEKYNVSGPSLVVCPLSVLESWMNEIKKWAPHLKSCRVHITNSEFKKDFPELGGYDIVVTTYEQCKLQSLKHYWCRNYFNLLVLDEGHRIKNMESLVSKGVRGIHAENRVILTGTPLANDLVELHALLNFLVPDVFTTAEPFKAAYDINQNLVDKSMLGKAHKLLNMFMLRRLKTLVEKKLPPKIETKVLCPLSNLQLWWYKAILLKELSLLTGDASKKPGSAVNNIIMQLRKAVNHPYIFDFVEDVRNQSSLEELVGESGKLATLDKLLLSLYKKGHRVCIFSQFTKVLDILDDYCYMRGWEYCRFDGGTSRAERNYIVNSFNKPDSEKFLFLMTTRSGGMGLNLQTADTVVLFDSDWNPQADLQAEARVHRLGQTKTVFVYRLVAANTIEERMLERAQKKLYLDRMVMRNGATVKTAALEEDNDDEEDSGKMLSALKFGCNAVFGAKVQKQTLPSDQDITTLTDRSRTVGDMESNAKDFSVEKAMTATTDFGGIDFKAIRKEYQKKRIPKDMGACVDLCRKKRERKSRLALVDDGRGSTLPVLKTNQYDLESGERSVFQQELNGKNRGSFKNPNNLKSKREHHHFDTCMACGDGGDLVCCPHCPVVLHLNCCGLSKTAEFMRCTHHQCSVCQKSVIQAGGFMYRCLCCVNAYCEDHMPTGSHVLDRCEPIEKLGYKIKNGVYILCSDICENVAKEDYDWKPPQQKERAPCPKPLNVSSYFGGEIDDCTEAPEELILHTKRRRKAVNYNDIANSKPGPLSSSLIKEEGNITKKQKPAAKKQQNALVKPLCIDLSSSTDSETSPVKVDVKTESTSNSGGSSSEKHKKREQTHKPLENGKAMINPEAAAGQSTVKERAKDDSLFSTYMATLPVTSNRLGIELAFREGYTVFSNYANDDVPRVFRNKLDRILAINEFSCEGKTLAAVIEFGRRASMSGPNVTFLVAECSQTLQNNSKQSRESNQANQESNPASSLPRKQQEPPKDKGLKRGPHKAKQAIQVHASTSKVDTHKQEALQKTYTATLPVYLKELGVRFGQLGENTVFCNYTKDHTPRVFRNRGDKLVGINDTSCEGKKFLDVMALLQAAAKTCQHVKLLMVQGNGHITTDSKETIKSESSVANSNVASAEEDDFEESEETFFTPPPLELKQTAPIYIAYVPFANRELGFAITESSQHGESPQIGVTSQQGATVIFEGYRRKKDGSMYEAELKRVFQTRGDRVLAVSGVPCEGKSFEEVEALFHTAMNAEGQHIHLRMEKVEKKKKKRSAL